MGDEVGTDLSDDDRVALRAFGRWLKDAAPALHAEIRAEVGGVLGDVRLARPDQVDPTYETRARALETGDWSELRPMLEIAARHFANAGSSPDLWFRVLERYQLAVSEVPEPSPELVRGVIRYSALVMRVVSEAYSTRQRDILNEARDERELYAGLVRQSPGPKVVYEWRRPPDRTSFYLLAANPAAQTMAPAILESLHAPISDRYPHFPTMELCDRIVETIETGAPTGCVVAAQAGGIFEAHVFVIRPRVVGVVFHDVTDRVRMQAAMTARLAEVEEANRSLDAFAYVASHDLKAPLRDIANLATWIDEDAGAGLPAPSRKHLAQLLDRVGRMDRLLDDLLAYSRVGRMSAVIEDTTLRAVVDDAIALAGPREGFEIVAPTTELPLRTARTPLVQVLRNLVDNALKHHDRPRGTIAIEVQASPDQLRVTVADDGPGIPPAFRERVFQPFTTLRPRDRVEGSGMGLAIVKKLVELHGGRIEIAAREGRGTRMTFTWPRQARQGDAR